MSVYAHAAHIYRDHGWVSPLPLPAAAKFPPPDGYTGADGHDPDDEQIARWADLNPDGNICLRMPTGVIGVDVDAYGDKHGAQSLDDLARRLGPLTPTWRSSARTAPSGIYFYRVPPGRYQANPATNIEIIQRNHRYAVVGPSIHPQTGDPYRWYTPGGESIRRPPFCKRDLTGLPRPYIDEWRIRETDDGAHMWVPKAHRLDDWTPAVTRAYAKALFAMPGGRHDACRDGALALIRLYSLEHPGAHEAVEDLGARFRQAIADRATPAQADKEWRDILQGAVAIVRETPSEAPKWEARDGGRPDPNWAPWWPQDEPAAEPAADAEPVEGLSGRVVFDLNFWNRNREGEQWLLEPILALGRAHALYAPPKAGKSLLALEIAAAIATGRPVLDQAAQTPKVVLYADFEMTEDDIYERLVDLGYSEADDLSRFHYHLHPVMPPLDTPHGGAALVDHAVRIGAELVVVDTVARTISGEENSSDTIIALARHTFTPLKARRITSVRVDHAGKDLAKGQRGTSAKNDDVDIVWQLTVADAGAVTLRATHRRLSWVPELVNLTRTENPLRHQPVDQVWPAGTAEAARKLDDAGAPIDISTREARALVGGKQHVVVAAVKFRKMHNLMPGSASGSTLSVCDPLQEGSADENTF